MTTETTAQAESVSNEVICAITGEVIPEGAERVDVIMDSGGELEPALKSAITAFYRFSGLDGAYVAPDEQVTLSGRNDGEICSRAYMSEHGFYCASCEDAYANAERDSYYDEDSDDNLCNVCYDDRMAERRAEEEDNMHGLYRQPNLTTRAYADRKQNGSVVLRTPTFGIELECDGREYSSAQAFADEIPESVGIVEDGSVDGEPSLEIVTPVLAGKGGEELVENVVSLAREHGFRVNNSCGFHVHIGGDGIFFDARAKQTTELEEQGYLVYHTLKHPHVIDVRVKNAQGVYQGFRTYHLHSTGYKFFAHKDDANEYRKEWKRGRTATSSLLRSTSMTTLLAPAHTGAEFNRLKTLVMLYMAFEDVLEAMLPKSRRHSRWNHSLNNDYDFEAVVSAQNYQQIERIWYSCTAQHDAEQRKGGGKYDDTRYHGVNLHNLFRGRGTFEVRYHSGTLNIKKILPWIRLQQSFAIACMRKEVRADMLRQVHASRGANMDERIKLMGEMLKLPPAVTAYVTKRINHFTNH